MMCGLNLRILLKGAVFSFFEHHVSSTPKVRPKLDGVSFPLLSEEENAGLISPLSMEEIELVVSHNEWIRACAFAGNLSVLVNGSPTSDINIQRGLKQGDPLAPFLFLLVVEGFSGVMRKAVEDNTFKGFSMGRSPVTISHLQYADDTLCIGEASVDNLWTLKAILHGFAMASGLKVNFLKSGLMGINVSPTFMTTASTFLNCKIGAIPFKYLGLPVGANPKCSSTWDPLLEHLHNRLFSWRHKYISLGGRIILINAVLNSISIFSLSFMKMPSVFGTRLLRTILKTG
jgi:hypothetical protein